MQVKIKKIKKDLHIYFYMYEKMYSTALDIIMCNILFIMIIIIIFMQGAWTNGNI